MLMDVQIVKLRDTSFLASSCCPCQSNGLHSRNGLARKLNVFNVYLAPITYLHKSFHQVLRFLKMAFSVD